MCSTFSKSVTLLVLCEKYDLFFVEPGVTTWRDNLEKRVTDDKFVFSKTAHRRIV